MVSRCAARAASAFRGRDFAWVRRAPQHTDQLPQLNKTISSIALERHTGQWGAGADLVEPAWNERALGQLTKEYDEWIGA
jgi:hypothetical protein